MKKYELIKTNTRQYLGEAPLYRVRYLINLPGIKAGDLGGWIRSKKNLSQITGSSRVCGEAIVDGNARVACRARVDGTARVCGNSIVIDNAVVEGNSRVNGTARICESGVVGDSAIVGGNSRVGDSATVCENAIVIDNAVVGDSAMVEGNSRVGGNARIAGIARIAGNVRVEGNSVVSDDSICEKFDPINITSLTYNVTITDNNVHIGCKTFRLEQALELASKWTSTKLNYEEAMKIEAEKEIIVEAIKYRLYQLAQLREGELV